jgi:hypothetical protein
VAGALGGVQALVGGGGWLVIGNQFYKIPPRPAVRAIIARAVAPRPGAPVESRELGEHLRNMLLQANQKRTQPGRTIWFGRVAQLERAAPHTVSVTLARRQPNPTSRPR